MPNLLEFYDRVTEQRDKGTSVDIVYLDFAKVFNTVLHKRVRKKLEAHRFRGRTCEWIGNWLSERRQRVIVNGEVSSKVGVVSEASKIERDPPSVTFLVFMNGLDLGLAGKISRSDRQICWRHQNTFRKFWKIRQCINGIRA